MRGGQWTHAHVGRAYDSLAAKASSQQARDFCKLYQMPSMQSYATARYGDNLCTQLASLWAAKMTFLYEYWCEQLGARPLPFPSAETLHFTEPEGIAAVIANLPPGAHATERFQQTRDLWPSLRKD